MEQMRLYHGSPNIVEEPRFGYGNRRNDYGEGFYCTEDRGLAGEWACSRGGDGIINSYSLDISDLDILRLNSGEFSILHWLRILIENRDIRSRTPVMAAGMEWLKENFSLDVSGYDVIIGYRADDSYFSFTRAFLANEISLEQLSHAMVLGGLGEQVVLKSRKAFDSIVFEGSEVAEAATYHALFEKRDRKARSDFSAMHAEQALEGLFIRDLIREGVRADDPRLFRSLPRRCHDWSGGGCRIRRPRLRDRCGPLHVVFRRKRIRRTLR